jgi:hypothetical protein
VERQPGSQAAAGRCGADTGAFAPAEYITDDEIGRGRAMVGDKKIVTLEDIPHKAVELEEYVAALFQAARYFVEKNVVEREPGAEILELDAVATSYELSPPQSVIVEAKSGGWGFADIFKVLGWMTYLQIGQGAFFASKIPDKKDPAFVHKKCLPLGVRFVHLGDFGAALARFAEAGFPKIDDEDRVMVWRLSYWAERNLFERLRAHAKANPTRQGPKAAIEYLHLVNNGVFFTPDIRVRLRELYTAYQSHPKLALGIATELGGGAYDPNAGDPKNPLIREAMQSAKHPLLHIAFYAEHRARLAILKAAVDHECAVEAGKIAIPKLLQPGQPLSLKLSDLNYWALPESFRHGLDLLKTHAAFRRYPLFWQVFLWGFGGFLLRDRKETEFKWLSEQTGVPVEEVPNALKAFDILFPIPGGEWFVTPGPTHATVLKMMPFWMRGLGAVQRRRRYGVEDYYKLGYKDYTGTDLAHWHNALIDLLAE